MIVFISRKVLSSDTCMSSEFRHLDEREGLQMQEFHGDRNAIK
jgi:hypothetical protein